MGLVVPPEGLTAMPPHTMQINGETGQALPLAAQGSPHQIQPVLKPASPKDAMTSIPEGKPPLTAERPRTQHFDQPIMGPSPPGSKSMSPPTTHGFVQQAPAGSFEDFAHMSQDDSDDDSPAAGHGVEVIQQRSFSWQHPMLEDADGWCPESRPRFAG
nr:hypothetical protein B0A51_15422 [Rachicladosporium sp. CCFEE 5018]